MWRIIGYMRLYTTIDYHLTLRFCRSDLFIISFVAVFSVLSGYFTVLIYEFASKEFTDKSAQTYATTQLNISFQVRNIVYNDQCL